MKKITLLFLLLVASFQLFASDWVKIDEDDGIVFYANFDMTNRHEIWIKQEFITYEAQKKEQESMRELIKDKALPSYTITLWEFNYDYTAMDLKSSTHYDANGRVLISHTFTYGEKSAIIPDSRGELFANIAKTISTEGKAKAKEMYGYYSASNYTKKQPLSTSFSLGSFSSNNKKEQTEKSYYTISEVASVIKENVMDYRNNNNLLDKFSVSSSFEENGYACVYITTKDDDELSYYRTILEKSIYGIPGDQLDKMFNSARCGLKVYVSYLNDIKSFVMFEYQDIKSSRY